MPRDTQVETGVSTCVLRVSGIVSAPVKVLVSL
jgi:hypothetical protein